MLTRQQIIKAIRDLHRREEPLNITAVKRYHPELIQAVYAVKPFWGWKRALEAAGVDYSKICVELEPYVTCQICGKELIALTYHIIKVHGASTDEYHIDYPDMPLFSEEYRASRARMKSRFLAHWERLWTPEYVLDRVAEFHRRNLPLNVTWINNNEKGFLSYVRRHFGKWPNVLKTAGLDPNAIYLRNEWRYSSKGEVIAAIKQRIRKGWPLYRYSLCVRDRKFRDYTLWYRGKMHFGSWRAALVAAGVDLSELYQKAFSGFPRYPDSQSVIREIRKRHRSGLDIHRKGVERGKHPNSSLVYSGIKYFGSWKLALKAAGFDLKVITMELRRRLWRYPDRQAVVGAIKRRARAGFPVNATTLVSGKRRDCALCNAARRLFGSWDAALKAAGFDPKIIAMELRRKRYPDRQAVIAGIKGRARMGLPVNSTALLSKGEQKNDTLYRTAGKLFGSWKLALKAAGFEPKVIAMELRRRLWRYPDRQAVIAGIKGRARMGFPVNAFALQAGEQRNETLYRIAKKLFGSWDAALKAAGLDTIRGQSGSKPLN